MNVDESDKGIEPHRESPDAPSSSLIHLRLPELSNAAEIGRLHLQACLETYPSPDLSIDEAWIREHWGMLATEEGTLFRQRTIREAQSNPHVLYRIAVVDGRIAGFVHVTRDEDKNLLKAIYTLEEYHGEGVGPRLMDEALAFADPALPTQFEVAADNARAIAFYSRYGFTRVAGTERLLANRIPVITMRRDPEPQLA
jgi:ribosomal protein S18 acetylase RimI-like enzyme